VRLQVGYPKETPAALAEHVEKNNLQGKMRFSLFGVLRLTLSLQG
jgi:hypothetical protein